MRRIGAMAAVAGLLCVGCGPRTHAHLVLRQYASDVVYGNQRRPLPPAPLPAASLSPSFPSFIQPPLPQPFTLAGPSATRAINRPAAGRPACPTASRFAFPALAADAHVPGPPAKAFYAYRQSGSYKVGGFTSQPPALALRTILNAKTNRDTTITFDIADIESGSTTTTSYLVDQRTGNSDADGIFITEIATLAADGSISQFTPATAIKIMPLPVDLTVAKFASAGTDPVHGLTMAVSGNTVGHARVDACGTPLDSWAVHVTGTIVGPTKQLQLDETYYIGTQFGGFPLQDTLNLSGSDGGVTVTRATTAIISMVPKAAGGGG